MQYVGGDVKKIEAGEMCSACGQQALVLLPINGAALHVVGASGCDCRYADTGGPVELPHVNLTCSACNGRVVRRPLDYVEPVKLPPPPDSLDALLAELSRALLAQFPDGKGASLFAETERRLRWQADYEKKSAELAKDKGWFGRIFGGSDPDGFGGM